jgi:hypothetical protein
MTSDQQEEVRRFRSELNPDLSLVSNPCSRGRHDKCLNRVLDVDYKVHSCLCLCHTEASS